MKGGKEGEVLCFHHLFLVVQATGMDGRGWAGGAAGASGLAVGAHVSVPMLVTRSLYEPLVKSIRLYINNGCTF